jgi:uncharacterized protein
MPMKVRYLNGLRFRACMLAMARNLENNIESINKVNVFPLPDKDTGTNMHLTLKSILKGLDDQPSENLLDIVDTVADSALMGCHGNSGSIIAQLFNSIADSINGHRLEVKDFAICLEKVLDNVWAALVNPIEGTIITVVQDWINAFLIEAYKSNDFVHVFKESIIVAKKSLETTPEKMVLLKKSGVVDAGALGFVEMLNGVDDLLLNGKELYKSLLLPKPNQSHDILENYKKLYKRTEEYSSPEYKFTVECLFISYGISREELRDKVKQHGSSVSISGNRVKFKIHLYTNNPEDLFIDLKEEGKVLQQRAQERIDF